MKQIIGEISDRIPSREEVAILSHDELRELNIHLLDMLKSKEHEIQSLRQEYEERLKKQQHEYEELLKNQRMEYEARLDKATQTLEARNEELERKINDLLRKLNTNSTNSSLPPSKDRIGFDRSSDKDDKDKNDGGKPPASGKPRSRGGQKGHKGHSIHFSPIPESSAIAAGGPPEPLSSNLHLAERGSSLRCSPQGGARKALQGRGVAERRRLGLVKLKQRSKRGRVAHA